LKSSETSEVLSRLQDELSSWSQSSEQRRLFAYAVERLQTYVSEESELFFISLPSAVYEGITAKKVPILLPVLTSILYLGIDILDDLADGDLQHEGKLTPQEGLILGTTLVSTFPHLLLAKLSLSHEQKNLMHETIARGLLIMSDGQQQDIASVNKSKVSTNAVELSVMKKSGEELAMFAALAAHTANAHPECVEHYMAYARALGVAGQLSSDCYDLFESQQSKDISNGTRTFPIAFCLERLKGVEKQIFLTSLQDAKSSLKSRRAIQTQLSATGAKWMTAIVTEIYCEKARSALMEARPFEPAAKVLQKLIRNASFFSKEEDDGKKRNRHVVRQVDERPDVSQEHAAES